MGKAIVFSEARIKALKPPAADRVYVKDKTQPGLQVCVTSAGTKTFYFVRRIDGRPTRVLLGACKDISVDQAREAAQIKAGQVASGRNPQTERRERRQEPTLGDLYAHWLIYATAHKKASSVKEDEALWGRYLKPWTGRRLSTVKKADVQAEHARLGRECGIYAANRMLALLRAMLNKADDIGYRGDNAAKGVKMFAERSRDRFLQPHEMEAFLTALDAAPDPFRDFFLLALLTGARSCNVKAMRWEDIDLEGRFWKLPETKANMAVVVPLVAPAVALLEARRHRMNGSPWVFPSHGKTGHLAEPATAWRRILAAAKLQDLRIHDLRRSVGSWMAGRNVSLTIIGKVLGHKTSQATLIYSRVALDPQREALDGATAAMLAAGKPKLLTKEGTDNGEKQ